MKIRYKDKELKQVIKELKQLLKLLDNATNEIEKILGTNSKV